MTFPSEHFFLILDETGRRCSSRTRYCERALEQVELETCHQMKGSSLIGDIHPYYGERLESLSLFCKETLCFKVVIYLRLILSFSVLTLILLSIFSIEVIAPFDNRTFEQRFRG